MNTRELQQLARDLKPDYMEEQMLQSELNSIKRVLEHNSRFSVIQTLPGGSFAKGTMVKGTFEADIVFLINRSVGGQPHDAVLDNLHQVLSANFWHNTSIKKQGIAVTMTMKKTPYNLKFDVLVGYAVNSPIQMAEVKKSKFYRGSTSKFHVEYAKKQKQQYQDYAGLVRVLKRWAKKKNVPLSGFQLELLAADGVKNSQQRNLSSCLNSTYRTIQGFCDGRKIYPVNWGQYFTKNEVRCQASPAGLLLVDPGDPSNNVASSIKAKNVSLIRGAAMREI